MRSFNTTRPGRPMRCEVKWQIALLLSLGASAAFSEPASSVDTSNLQYHSVFSRYKGFNEQEVTPWRQTNESAEKAGGWRVYAKDARKPDVLEEKAKADADKPKMNDMRGGKP